MKKIIETLKRKWAEYLLEVFVILGSILGAFTLDNWNEEHKEQKLVLSSLNSMKLNITEDINELNKQLEYNRALEANIKFLFKLINSSKFADKRLSDYGDSIGDITQVRDFTPNTISFKSMESNSHLQWIKNEQLVKSIYQYYAKMEDFAGAIQNNIEFSDKYVQDFVFVEMDLGSHFSISERYGNSQISEYDNTNLFRDNRAIQNALIGRLFRAYGEIEGGEKGLILAKEMINKIDEYIKKYY